jgi:rhodanese-related sulfurtransferase
VAGEPVEALQSVQDVLDGADLLHAQRPGFRRREPERRHALGRVAVRQQLLGGVRGDPGEQRRQVGQVVVHCRRRHRRAAAVLAGTAARGEVVTPGGHLPRGDRRHPVVAERVGEPVAKPGQVPGDLARDLLGADPTDRKVEVLLDPDRQGIVGRIEAGRQPEHLS